MEEEDRDHRRRRRERRRRRRDGRRGGDGEDGASGDGPVRYREEAPPDGSDGMGDGMGGDGTILDPGAGGSVASLPSFRLPSGDAPVPPPPPSAVPPVVDPSADAPVDDARDALLSELQSLCDAATPASPPSWDAVRTWLRCHSARDARAASERRGDYDAAPLHLACRNGPPVDVVEALATAGPRAVGWADSFGWLPLHYACANEASESVLVLLAERRPSSKTSVDKRKRTPLHFALGHTERPASEEAVALLSDTGAALMPDENGMLPLHYACAYGATERALRVLTDANLHTVSAADHRGRTPLHFALGNADRPASPGVVALLLSQNPAVVDAVDLEGNLPVHLLATRAGAIKEHEKEKRANCRECFRKYLEAGPNATADLLTALQSLPDWLRDEAVLSPVVQKILNAKIATRFPTMIVVMDLFFYVLVIAFFQVAVVESLRDRHADPPKDEMHRGWLAPLYLAAFYFSAREVVQAFSLASLGLFDTWVSDRENWLDVVYVVFILFWAVVMNGKWLSTDAFQIGTALTMALFWVMVLNFLRSIIVGFAVFAGGVVYVVKRLLSFLLALAVILIMFTMIFHTLFRDPTGQCPSQDAADYTQFPVVGFDCGVDLATGDEECEKVVDCQPINTDPFCNFRTSFFKVLTMLLGEVDEVYFQSNVLLVLAYAVFMFACVIVLANVLIAIVTSSYSVIQNERAALVFWSNRLDFVAEMDVISNNFSRRPREGGARDAEESSSGELWKKFMYLFDDDVEEHGILSVEFVCYNVLRFFALFFVVPLWILLGLVTFGLLWPPQVRVWLLTSQMTSVSKEASAERSRLQQVHRLKEDVASFQEEVRGEMERGRNEMHAVRTVLEGTRNDIHEEMNNVKEIVTELFELLSAP